MSWQMILGSMEVLSESVSSADNLSLTITIASSMGTLVNKLFTSKLTIKSHRWYKQWVSVVYSVCVFLANHRSVG